MEQAAIGKREKQNEVVRRRFGSGVKCRRHALRKNAEDNNS